MSHISLADRVLRTVALLHISGVRYVTRTDLWNQLSRNNPNLKRPSLSCCISNLIEKQQLCLRNKTIFPQQFYIPTEKMPFVTAENENDEEFEISLAACKLLLLGN